VCGASFSASPWARLSSFWLVFCFALVQVPISGQSTTPGPRLADGTPKSVTTSTETLLTLWDVLNDSRSKWESSQSELETLRAMLETGETKLAGLSTLVGELEAGSTRLSESLAESLRREESTHKAAEDREKASQKAIDEARTGQVLVGVAAFLAGAGVYAGAHFFGLVP